MLTYSFCLDACNCGLRNGLVRAVRNHRAWRARWPDASLSRRCRHDDARVSGRRHRGRERLAPEDGDAAGSVSLNRERHRRRQRRRRLLLLLRHLVEGRSLFLKRSLRKDRRDRSRTRLNRSFSGNADVGRAHVRNFDEATVIATFHGLHGFDLKQVGRLWWCC